MRTIQCVHGFPPELAGGTERYVRALTAALHTRGIESTIIAGVRDCQPHTAAVVRQAGEHHVVEIHRHDAYHDRWDRLANPEVARLVGETYRAERPDLVHVHHWLRLSDDLVRQARAAGIPVVVTVHDLYSTCPIIHRVKVDASFCCEPAGLPTCLGCLEHLPELKRSSIDHELARFKTEFRKELAGADCLMALSNDHAELLAELHRLPRHAFGILPFAPQHRLRPSPRPPAAPPLRVANWGGQSAFKGQQVLLEAVARMRHRQAVEVHLYGGFDHPEFDRTLERLRAGQPVTRHGPFEYETLEREPFHVAVFPTLCRETYGFVVDEAQMLGLPLLVSDIGAYAERLEGGGETFPRGDADALAARLDAYIEDPARLQRMREVIPVPPTFEAHVDAVVDAYEGVMRG